MLDAVIVEIGAGVRREEGRAVIVRINLPDHIDGVHDLFFGLGRHAQHIIGPDGQAVLAAEPAGLQVAFDGRALAQEVQDALVAALKADEVTGQAHLAHRHHQVLVPARSDRPVSGKRKAE